MNDIEVKKQKTIGVLSGIKNLPSIPKVVFEVTKLLNNPQTSASALAELISKDYGLTSRILTVANSPLYGIKRKVSSIEFAVLILGFQDIQSIVTALSLVDTINIVPGLNFDPAEFWTHSMVVGTAARGISQHMGFDFGGEAFVAGILHDIGELVIYNYFKKDFDRISKISAAEKISIIDSEIKVLGVSHQEVGRFLTDKWNLPEILCEAINYHHIPSKASVNKKFVSTIHLVDYMTHRLGIASSNRDKDFVLDASILDTLNFPSEEALDNFIVDYEEMFKVTAESLKI